MRGCLDNGPILGRILAGALEIEHSPHWASYRTGSRFSVQGGRGRISPADPKLVPPAISAILLQSEVSHGIHPSFSRCPLPIATSFGLAGRYPALRQDHSRDARTILRRQPLQSCAHHSGPTRT